MQKAVTNNSYKICVVGAGHVGLVTAVCFAELGYKVICIDNDENKIRALKRKILPFYEPGLKPLVVKNLKAGNLTFSFLLKESILKSEVIFIVVGTPPLADGSADLAAVENIARLIAENLNSYKLIVEKSTVPVQTGKKVKETIYRYRKHNVEFDVASNPEFLREGKAVYDFFHPDRIVIGVESKRAELILKKLYSSIKAPLVTADINTSELIKHASNSFLSTKISFINAVARVCDLSGADIKKVSEAMGLDKRIGKDFLNAGIGYGGFCLEGREKIIIKDNLDNVYLISLKDLFEKYKEARFEALSFDREKRKVCFRRISLVSKRQYQGKMIEFTTKMHRKITVTADHPMIKYENNQFFTVCAEQIREGDYFPLFTNFPSLNKNIIIDLFEILQGVDFFDGIKVRPASDNIKYLPRPIFQFLKKEKSYSPTRIFDFKRKNYLILGDYLLLEKNGLLPGFQRENMLLFTTKGTPTYIKGKFMLDNNILKLLGYYITEGHITSEKCKRGQRDRIVFSFNQKENEYIKDVTSSLEYLCLKYKIKNIFKDKVIRITISSRIFAYLIQTLNCGRNSYDACVPSPIFSLSPDKRTVFLSSLYRGDGYVYFHPNTFSVSYEYGTVSRALKDNMVSLFHSIGIVPHLKVFQSAKSTVPAYNIRISGYKQIRSLPLFKDRITQSVIDSRLDSLQRHIKPTGYTRVNKDFCIAKVKKINSYYTNEDVYSLEVEGTETFITSEGIIVHNCFPKDLEAFIYISKKLGYDFGLLREVKKINEEQRAYFMGKIKEHLWVMKGKKIAILGLSFKPDTDDMRFAPSIDIVNSLLKEGANLSLYDPQAIKQAKEIFSAKGGSLPVRQSGASGGKDKRIKFSKSPYEAAKNSDCICFLTEWKEFYSLDLKRIKKVMHYPLIADGRNIFDKNKLTQLGFKYIGIGT